MSNARIPSVHQPMDKLRRARDGKFTEYSEFESVLHSWLDECPGNAILIVDQPGLSVNDFQQLVTSDNVLKFHNLRLFAERGATVGSFPRVNAPVNIEDLAQHVVDKCSARLVRADPQCE